MKTYENEYKELVEWMKIKTKEHMEYVKEDNTPGRDGKLVYERQQVVNEYNRRLDALKKKYGKEIMPQETASRKETERVHV